MDTASLFIARGSGNKQSEKIKPLAKEKETENLGIIYFHKSSAPTPRKTY